MILGDNAIGHTLVCMGTLFAEPTGCATDQIAIRPAAAQRRPTQGQAGASGSSADGYGAFLYCIGCVVLRRINQIREWFGHARGPGIR